MTASDSVEIELKLALPPQQAEAFRKLMARRRAPPLQQELVTRYFDTPDFSLSAQGVTLRVRRVGRRWLQTLKTEGERRGGLSQRGEYEMAITHGSLDWTRFPAAALAQVPEALRTQLEPVFETRFNRTAWLIKGRGRTQIEVALDVGEVRAKGRSQPICEIELELKAGQPDALFALALGWAGRLDCLPFDVSKAERGLRLAQAEDRAPVKSAALALDRAMTVEEGFAAMVQTCLAQFQSNLPELLASEDIEYLHQARVALRRLRAVLRQYRQVCLLPDELMDGLRRLAAALGPVRDWDVLCNETLPAIAPHYPDADTWQQGMQALQAHRTKVRAALIQLHPGAWLLALQRWLLQCGWRSVPEAQRLIQLSPLQQWAGRVLRKGHKHIVRGARDFGELQAARRHALRISIKRQRYAAEFFQTLFCAGHKRRQKRYLAVLRDAQNHLGRSNDARVAWGLLNRVQADAGPMRDFVLGWLAATQAEAADGVSVGPVKAFMKLKPYW